MSKHTPEPLRPVLAKISHQNDLGLSSWYEVVYFETKWHPYHGSKTFQDGERVIDWRYCDELEHYIPEEIQVMRDEIKAYKAEITELKQEKWDCRTELDQLRADKARLVEALEKAIPYMERSLEVHSRIDAKAFRQLLTEIGEK